MHRIYSALIDIVAAAIFIVPLLALYGKISLRSLKQTLIYIVFAFYLVAVLSLVGFPSVLSLNLDFTINIIPLVDMISDFVNACLNVLLFVPLGFLLPMLEFAPQPSPNQAIADNRSIEQRICIKPAKRSRQRDLSLLVRFMQRRATPITQKDVSRR